MKTRAGRRLVIPARFAVTVLGTTVLGTTVLGVTALGLSCTTTSTPADSTCEPVAVKDAGILTYECRDGRTCDPPDPTQIDGGTYQVCPGNSDCATLVTYQGQATLGFC